MQTFYYFTIVKMASLSWHNKNTTKNKLHKIKKIKMEGSICFKAPKHGCYTKNGGRCYIPVCKETDFVALSQLRSLIDRRATELCSGCLITGFTLKENKGGKKTRKKMDASNRLFPLCVSKTRDTIFLK